MGKAQSKRSVDITIEGKKGTEEEVTGKLEKIEDTDQTPVNGDAGPQDNTENDKKELEVSENDKDLTTEKTTGDGPLTNGEQNNDEKNCVSSTVDSQKKDEVVSNANASKEIEGEEISPLTTPATVADESIKKQKKEKVKKKWSFRSISFGKKDKQKPAKTEENAEHSATVPAPVTNNEIEQCSNEGETHKDEEKNTSAAVTAAVSDEIERIENGESNEKQQQLTNGQNTESNNLNEAVSTSTSVTTDSVNEVKVESFALASATEAAPAIAVTNGNINDDDHTKKNGHVEELINDVENSAVSSELTPNDTNNDEKPHQNGVANENDNVNKDDMVHDKAGDADILKSHIEVNINNTMHNIFNNSLTTTDTTTHVTNNIDINNESETNPCLSIYQTSSIIAENEQTTEGQSDKEQQITDVIDNDDSKNIIVSTDNKDDEIVTPLNNTSSVSQISPCVLSPPLPVVPPPSQVTVFALSTDQDYDTTNTSIQSEICKDELILETEVYQVEDDNKPKEEIELENLNQFPIGDYKMIVEAVVEEITEKALEFVQEHQQRNIDGIKDGREQQDDDRNQEKINEMSNENEKIIGQIGENVDYQIKEEDIKNENLMHTINSDKIDVDGKNPTGIENTSKTINAYNDEPSKDQNNAFVINENLLNIKSVDLTENTIVENIEIIQLKEKEENYNNDLLGITINNNAVDIIANIPTSNDKEYSGALVIDTDNGNLTSQISTTAIEEMKSVINDNCKKLSTEFTTNIKNDFNDEDNNCTRSISTAISLKVEINNENEISLNEEDYKEKDIK